jgi:predicted P-loop ATPase
MTNISFYARGAKQSQGGELMPFDLFLEEIKNGKWQDQVIKLRAIADETTRAEAKKLIPYVTISGIFGEHRRASELKAHSNYIGIDIDKLYGEKEGIKSLLIKDPYVYAAFTSVSGTGLCIIMKIEGDKHLESFCGIADYLLKSYQLLADPHCKDVSRARFVSFDPDIYINPGSAVFKKYLPKQKERKIPPQIFVQSEFDNIIQQMYQMKVSCVEDYRDWLLIGFGLADKFGEAGRKYFHTLSSCSQKYDPKTCDKQFDSCVSGTKQNGKITISTIYWYAKQAGININSEKTKRIASVTSSCKKAGVSKEDIINNLQKFEGISAEESTQIVEQAFASNANFHEDKDSLIDGIIAWLRHNYNMRRNIITRKIENDKEVYEDLDFNTIFLECKKIFSDLTSELFNKIIFSRFTKSYNPFLEFYESNKEVVYNNEIDELWNSIDCDDPDKLKYFGTKWLLSIISSIHGMHSPLMLVFAGEIQGTGKTEFFRRLLPTELKQYYAESKLDKETDDEILMCQKLIIMDDEMGGKSKKENKRLKELTSKQTFSLREPYGHVNVDLNRLAVLCGTSNDLGLLNDPTGNRRLIPIQIIQIDKVRLNKINRVSLFIELFRRFLSGDTAELNSTDVARLNNKSEQFQDFTSEYELINKWFTLPTISDKPSELTATEIKNILETKTVQKLSLKKIGEELKRIGFKSTIKKINKKATQLYLVVENISTGITNNFPSPNDDDPDTELPF